MCSPCRNSLGGSQESSPRTMEAAFWMSIIPKRKFWFQSNTLSMAAFFFHLVLVVCLMEGSRCVKRIGRRTTSRKEEEENISEAIPILTRSLFQRKSNMGLRRHILLLPPHPRRPLCRPHPPRYPRLRAFPRSPSHLEQARRRAHRVLLTHEPRGRKPTAVPERACRKGRRKRKGESWA